MKRNLIIGLLVVALVAVGYWGVKKNQVLTKWEEQTENQYRNAFHELNNNLEALETGLATALVTKSSERRLVKLNNIWRNCFAVQEDLGELPIAGVSLTKFKKLIAKTERYTYRLAQNNLKGNLIAKDWNNLSQLHSQIKIAAKEFEEIHNQIEQEGFRWSDQRHIVLEEQDFKNNRVLSSLQGLEKKGNEINLDLLQRQASKIKLQVGDLEGDKEDRVTNREQAVKLAQNFLGERSKKYQFKVADDEINPKNDSIITVMAYAEHRDNGEIMFDISRNLGKVIWFLEQRSFGEAKLETKEIKQKAEEFLTANNYDNLAIKKIKLSRNIGTVILAPKEEGVLIYPQEVRVKVALDNGSIIGFNSREYLLNQDLEVDLEPKLSVAEAKSKVNQRLELTDNQLVVIRDDQQAEILSYEFIGSLKESEYKVYINANTGREEEIVQVKQDE
ncbi:MAG: PepSY1/2 domain-containing protein [Bacillota bacterium]